MIDNINYRMHTHTNVKNGSTYLHTRILIGILLVFASLLKGHELATGPTVGQGLLNSRGFLAILVEIELLFGVWLLIGLCPIMTRRLAFAGFSLFFIASLSRAVAGESSCGCFGRLAVPPILTAAIDAAAVAALARWAPEATDNSTIRSHPARFMGFLLIAFLIGPLAAVAMARSSYATLIGQGTLIGDEQIVLLKPEAWVGKSFPLRDYVDIGSTLMSGDWVVILYHHDCVSCQEVIPLYELRARTAARRTDSSRIALIEMPPYAPSGMELVTQNSPCMLGHLDNSREWFLLTPAEILLSDGYVMPPLEPSPRP